MTGLSVIILAGGAGTRMKSKTPKHLHKIGNLEIIFHIINTAKQLNANEIVVVCSPENYDLINVNEIKTTTNNGNEHYFTNNIKKVIQKEKLGTANAAQTGYDGLEFKDNDIIIMYGDIPLVKLDTYNNMLNKLKNDVMQVGLIFKTKDISNKYGRVKIEDDKLIYNVEYKDADIITKNSDLCNGAILTVKGNYLNKVLKKIDNNNITKEYYLTDIINISNADGMVSKYILVDENEIQGINSREDLSKAENIFQNNIRKKVMENGATLIDPNSVYFSYDTEIGQDVIVEPNVVFAKGVKVENNVTIKSFVYLSNRTVKEGEIVESFTK
ncbi:MAG: NTP transferase domain-containing protein [Rickettsiales bacterium]|jgi:bifunctional UDP-N-acetylglucosamine pyrophosphorylase/glucosamine-1-phosphate N-acetyltransferase|nr:NTP transferase domain-containing protein [Rickettsiales bacterium]